MKIRKGVPTVIGVKPADYMVEFSYMDKVRRNE